MGIPGEPSPPLHRRQGVIAELGAAEGDQQGVLGRRPRCGKNEAPAAPTAKGEWLKGQGLKGPKDQEISPVGNDRCENRSPRSEGTGASCTGRPNGSTRES